MTLWRSDFAVCKYLGWTVPDLMALPVSVYDELIRWVNTQADDAAAR